MKAIVIALGLLVVGATCEASDTVRATLEPSTNRSGLFVIRVTNVSRNAIRFLDIREGSGECGDFYEVTVQRGAERYESKGNCFYAPADMPKTVELAPGKTYERDIQPSAYVWGEAHLAPPCSITVTYRLSDKIKARWRALSPNIDLDFTFRTDTIEISASNKRGELIQPPSRQPGGH